MRYIIAIWLALGAWGIAGGWPLVSNAGRRDASLECQRRRMESRPAKDVRPEDVCVCNAAAGLPETPACRRMRGQ